MVISWKLFYSYLYSNLKNLSLTQHFSRYFPQKDKKYPCLFRPLKYGIFENCGLFSTKTPGICSLLGDILGCHKVIELAILNLKSTYTFMRDTLSAWYYKNVTEFTWSSPK